MAPQRNFVSTYPSRLHSGEWPAIWGALPWCSFNKVPGFPGYTQSAQLCLYLLLHFCSFQCGEPVMQLVILNCQPTKKFPHHHLQRPELSPIAIVVAPVLIPSVAVGKRCWIQVPAMGWQEKTVPWNSLTKGFSVLPFQSMSKIHLWETDTVDATCFSSVSNCTAPFEMAWFSSMAAVLLQSKSGYAASSAVGNWANPCCTGFHFAFFTIAQTLELRENILCRPPFSQFLRFPPCMQLWNEILKPSASIIASHMSGKSQNSEFSGFPPNTASCCTQKRTILAVAAWVWFAAWRDFLPGPVRWSTAAAHASDSSNWGCEYPASPCQATTPDLDNSNYANLSLLPSARQTSILKSCFPQLVTTAAASGFRDVNVHGFSAGSYTGLAVHEILSAFTVFPGLTKVAAIATPPEMMRLATANAQSHFCPVLSSPSSPSTSTGFCAERGGCGISNPFFAQLTSFFSFAFDAVPHAGAGWTATMRCLSPYFHEIFQLLWVCDIMLSDVDLWRLLFLFFLLYGRSRSEARCRMANQ